MAINFVDALSAYRKGGGISSAGAGGAAENVEGASFGDVLKDYASGAMESLKESEKSTVAAATGKTSDLTALVTQINKAELMLQTVVGIRDKVITAYQEVTKLPI
jgi:flagellar hook-basal body complex protein FliE